MISITTVGCTFLLLIGAKCDFFELIQAIPEGNEFIIISETKSGKQIQASFKIPYYNG